MTPSWLISLGLTNAVLATLLALVALATGRLVRSPALTHLLWIIVLLKLITPPLVQIPIGWKLAILPERGAEATYANPTDDLSIPSAKPPIVVALSGLPPTTPTSGVGAGAVQPTAAFSPDRDLAIARPPASHRTFTSILRSCSKLALAYLPAVWLVGAAAMLALIVYRAWQFFHFIRDAGDTHPALASRLVALARQTKLRSTPKLIVVQGAISPLLCGVGSSTRLIFPSRLARELSPSACDTLLLHELAHYSRGDQWVRLVELACEVIFWWHPVVWWARNEIEAAEEQCCDAWVIQHQSATRRTYAEALLAAIDFLSDQPTLLPPTASGLGDVPFLKLRLTQIMRGQIAAKLSLAAKLPVLMAALVLLPLGPPISSASATSSRFTNSTRATPLVAATSPLEASPRDPASSPTASDKSESPLLPTGLPEIAAVRPTTLITASAVSLDGQYRLERRKGDQVTLVNETGGFRLNMTNHRILCASFTPDSRSFVTGHGDSHVRIWDSQTGGLVGTLKGNTAAVWSVDVIASAAGGYWIAAGAQDGSVLVWDLASGEELAHLAPSGVSVNCLRWSHDGTRLAISYGDFSDDDQTALVIWSPRENDVSLEAPLARPMAAVAWLPGDESLLAADWTGEAIVWRLADDAAAYRISLGNDGKQIAEAAHWSANCPLVPGWLTAQTGTGADE